MNKKELWLKLKSYHFDHVVPLNLWTHITAVFGGTEPSSKAFASKIARKSGWTKMFALNALSEYKKFVYLGVVSDFPVTPSKIIDQVWHEHLLFSKAYRQFCTDVIDYTFDHNPELIPMTDQTGNFNLQYLDTVALYKMEFGIDPPADIWSVPKFDQKKVEATGSFEVNKKKNNPTIDTYFDAPLVSFFDISQQGDSSYGSFPEFSGFEGGEFGGAGAVGSWDSTVDLDSSSNSSSDSGGSDGGSGCSSGCGGGD
ncbi:MAG: hypothetical protein JWQ09_5348 [Segetibacter sp.]|nr:hypothetical protein [Segetibacter sp.]